MSNGEIGWCWAASLCLPRLAWILRISGRRVAREAAVIPKPGSMMDQIVSQSMFPRWLLADESLHLRHHCNIPRHYLRKNDGLMLLRYFNHGTRMIDATQPL